MSENSYTSTSIQSGDKITRDAIAKTYAEAGEKVGLKRYVFIGLVLLLLPFLAILYQSHQITRGTLIRLPVQIGALQKPETQSYMPIRLLPSLQLLTPLNQISTKTLTGHNTFKAGQKVFVFLSPGPNDIWYAYAVSKRAPKSGCYVTSCLILSGHIQSTDQDMINIRYQYENFVPEPDMMHKFERYQYANAEIFLSIGRNGRTTVRALNVNGERIDQRNMPIEALFGLIQRIAKTAPAT